MAGINSSSYYSASVGTSGNGMAGLASGMDTESMVEKMLSGTQAAIDKQEGLKQQNVWKQDIYREIISSINSFQNMFFNSTYGASSTNNLSSAAFYNSMLSAVSRGSAVKVLSSSSNASVGNMKVAVERLASSALMNSEKKMSTGRRIESATAMTPDKLDALLNNRVQVVVDGENLDIDLSGATTIDDVAARINQAFSVPDPKFQGKVTAKVFDGRLRLVTKDDTVSLTVNRSKSGLEILKMTGLDSFSSADVKNENGDVIGTMIQGSTPQAGTGYSFDMTLDGVTKTISLKNIPTDPVTGKVTAQKVKEALDGEVQRAFGSYVKVGLSGDDTDGYKFSFSLDTTESGHELVVTGKGVKDALGIVAGSSTSVNSGTKLSDLGVTGDKFAFKINGREFSFTGSDTIGAVLNKVNSSDAGVRLTYSSVADTFKMESTSSGEKYNIKLEQTEGDLLTAMFGSKVAASDTASSIKLTTNHINGIELDPGFTAKIGASLSVTVNGMTGTFVLKPRHEDDEAPYTKAEIETEFNTWLKKTFNPETEQEDADPAKISYQNGNLVIAEGYKVSFNAPKVDMEDPEAVKKAMENDLAFAMGFNRKATSNTATGDTLLQDVYDVSGMDIRDAYGAPLDITTAKMSEIGSIGGQAVSFADGRLVLSGTGSVDLRGTGLDEIFGKDSVDFSDGQVASGAISQGSDAVIRVNGETTTRSSNTVTIDGVTMELTQVSPTDASGNLEDTIITTSRDTDSIVKGFQSFVEEYNKMIEKLNGFIDEKATYREYPPLSSGQKKELSDREVELWEEKAQVGLIRNDSTVSSFLSEMRLALYNKPEGSRYALYNIGIETTEDYKSKGKLQMDETALRNALAADPDAVKNLFISSTDGLAKQLTNAMNRAAKESSGSPGSLVRLAGTTRVMEKNNTTYEKISRIESRIKDLKVKYEKDRVRYWNQFSKMESILSNYNQQSMMLTNQFSSGY